ncbi:MAG: transposase [Bacteroides sp.]|nr:transposase [Bacteroides sp.]
MSIVRAILFKLKTGCQWQHLPVCHFFEGEIPSYKTVFYHNRKWCKLGGWENLFSRLVGKYRHLAGYNRIQLEGV